MNRRSFLKALGVATIAPALPVEAVKPAVAVIAHNPAEQSIADIMTEMLTGAYRETLKDMAFSRTPLYTFLNDKGCVTFESVKPKDYWKPWNE